MKTNQNQNLRALKIALPFLLLLSFLSFSTGPLSAEESCAQACSHYVACAGELNQRTPTNQERQILTKGCMDICQSPGKKGKILSCYKKSKNSCSAYNTCILQSAQ